MWGTFKRQLLAAYLAVGVIVTFVVVFICVTVGTRTHIMAPVGVRFFCNNCSGYCVYVVATVLVLDGWQRDTVRPRTHCRRICVDLGSTAHIGDQLCPIVIGAPRNSQSSS